MTRPLIHFGGLFTVLLLSAFFLSACSQKTYPSYKLKEAIQQICEDEYGIEDVDVKVVGKTLGVYLPVNRLFATDLKEAFLGGNTKIEDVENLFRPSPEALDKIEDVLFAISRVLLSTDMKIDFYSLQATDVEQTGLQLVLNGYLDDIKRVRLWDISREEYRKRILHEIRLNRAAVWHRPVRSFFKSIRTESSLEEVNQFFEQPISRELYENLFLLNLNERGASALHWKLGEMRSTPLEESEVLVYVPARVQYDSKEVAEEMTAEAPSGSFLEFLFVVSFAGEMPRIVRVIPLSFLNQEGKPEKLAVPEIQDLQHDLQSWDREFSFSDIHLGDFLAEQLTRRTQALLFSDERVRNTLDSLQLAFHFHEESQKNYFSLEMDARPKTPGSLAVAGGVSLLNEDLIYVLTLASREFVDVLRSYRFSEYDYLQLTLASDPIARVLEREDLELLRRNKVDLQGLLRGVSPL